MLARNPDRPSASRAAHDARRARWPRAQRLLFVATTVTLVVACDRQTPAPAPLPSSSSAAPGPLPHRAEVVRHADDLAVAAAAAKGETAARLAFDAARLRARIWRLERREQDALEAIELFSVAAVHDERRRCAARIESALLEGELRSDPSAAFHGVYAARAEASGGDCTAPATAALTALTGFRPLPGELAAIDREAARVRGARPTDAEVALDAPAAAAPDAAVGSNEAVVLPEISPGASRGAVRITSVERYGSKDSARVVVSVTAPTHFEAGYLPRESAERGPRFYVDIRHASYAGKLAYDVGGVVERVRLGKQQGGTRVVLDLTADVRRRVFYVPEPFRLVIDVSAHTAAPTVPDGEAKRLRRVVLDPGHGGHDPGAVGAAGLREKDVTLDIAHRAAPLIARELGIVTLLTRDTDDYVPLDERAARANAFGADLFLSIHCNASENPAGRGVMTFVLDEAVDAASTHVAARENFASPAAAAELATVMSRVVDRGTRAQSLHFAELLQRSAAASLAPRYPSVPDQGVKRAGFYVLAGASMPAALFEASFVSNPVEEQYLDTADYRQKMADAIANAIRAYRDGR